MTAYSGSADDAALNAGIARYASDPSAVNYIEHYYTPIGDLHVPVITLHATRDPIVPIFHEEGNQGLGEGGPAIAAEITPFGLALDAQGNIFTADTGSYFAAKRALIREVTIDGIIRTGAGQGTIGYSGDGKPALSADLNAPSNVAIDSSGNFYIADSGNQRIRNVDGVNLSTSYFPHLAVGGGWFTLFTFTNTGSTEASGLLTLKDAQGHPLLVKGQWASSAGTGNPASSFPFSVPSGGSISLLTTAAAIADTNRTGWALLETAGN